MDIREFNAYVDGYIEKRESLLNDYQTIGHIISGKIAAAVWADKSFKKPLKEIKLKDVLDEDEILKKQYDMLKSKGVDVDNLKFDAHGLVY